MIFTKDDNGENENGLRVKKGGVFPRDFFSISHNFSVHCSTIWKNEV